MAVIAPTHFPSLLEATTQLAKARSGTPRGRQRILSPAQTGLKRQLLTAARQGTLPPEADRFFGAVHQGAVKVYGPALGPRIFFRLFPDPFIALLQQLLKNRQATMKAFFDAWGESLRENAELDKKAAERSQEKQRDMLRVAKAREQTAHAVLQASLVAAHIAPASHAIAGVTATHRVQLAPAAPSTPANRTATEGLSEGPLTVDAPVQPESSTRFAQVSSLLAALDEPADGIGVDIRDPHVQPGQKKIY